MKLILLIFLPLTIAISNVQFPIKIEKQRFQYIFSQPKFYRIRMETIGSDSINVNQDLGKEKLTMPLKYNYRARHRLRSIPFFVSPKMKTTEHWYLYDGKCVGNITTKYLDIEVILYWNDEFIRISTSVIKKASMIPISNLLIENDIGNQVKDSLISDKVFN